MKDDWLETQALMAFMARLQTSPGHWPAGVLDHMTAGFHVDVASLNRTVCAALAAAIED